MNESSKSKQFFSVFILLEALERRIEKRVKTEAWLTISDSHCHILTNERQRGRESMSVCVVNASGWRFDRVIFFWKMWTITTNCRLLPFPFLPASCGVSLDKQHITSFSVSISSSWGPLPTIICLFLWEKYSFPHKSQFGSIVPPRVLGRPPLHTWKQHLSTDAFQGFRDDSSQSFGSTQLYKTRRKTFQM